MTCLMIGGRDCGINEELNIEKMHIKELLERIFIKYQFVLSSSDEPFHTSVYILLSGFKYNKTKYAHTSSKELTNE